MTLRLHRRRSLTSAVLIAAAVAGTTSPRAADVVQPRGLVRELDWVLFSQPNGPTLYLKAIVARPAAAGRFRWS